jgi:SAM-dependent methyltransferase
MITLKSCPNCNSNNISEYKTVLNGDLVCEIGPGIKVNGAIVTRYCICQSCSLIFQNPRMADFELDKYYSSGAYRQTTNAPPEGMDKSEDNRAKIDTSIIKKYTRKPASHLDVGCGRGYLLNRLNAKLKVGVESEVGYVKAKNVLVYKKINSITQRSFDLVTVIHTLEHVSDPLGYLRKTVKLLSKNGFLVIEVPSWKTRGGPLGLAHLSHFEPDVLKLMCKQVGLSVEHTEFTPHLMVICKK